MAKQQSNDWLFDTCNSATPQLLYFPNNDNGIINVETPRWSVSLLGHPPTQHIDYLQELKLHRFTPLDITTTHALAVEQLPPHHKDPFDRMLIAQAQIEKLTLVTRDERIKAYNVSVIET
ncbi:MAG: type II toxin-antitoxin system VapC family toxin [Chloroflexi bacterium]|nr:type II toxin-antitoxin system VapC family toxin [Chloroflexota bacterium]